MKITNSQAIEELKKMRMHFKSTLWKEDASNAEEAINIAIKALTDIEDLVEVVRCKYCQYFAGEGMYCEQNIIPMFDHFYCYYGDRRQDDGNAD